MIHPRARSVHLAVLLSLAAAPGLRADVYVDAVNGSDTNSGTSWQDAWRTITRAVAGAPGDTVHVAAGTYDAALGESFPIALPWTGITVAGARGSAVTVIDGGGAPAIFAHGSFQDCHGGSAATLRGLWLRNAGKGIATASDASLALLDVRISACGTGIETEAWTLDPLLFGVCAIDVSLERVHVFDCGTAYAGSIGSSDDPEQGWSTLRVTAVDSVFSGNGVGLRAEAAGQADAELELVRCRIEDNGVGVAVSSLCPPLWPCGSTTCRVTDSLVARNGTGCSSGELAGMLLARCTIARNTGCGAASTGGGLALSHCIVDGNGDDLCGTGIAAEYCEIGDGDLAGTSGNFSADPRFADAAAGDFRLAFGSPCTDAGQPGHGTGTVDLLGTARPVDGDLDTVERPDVGAYEHAPLFLRAPPRLGETLKLELWGPAGGASTVYFAAAPLAAPLATPFGELDLERRLVRFFAHSPVAPGPPVRVLRALPTDPALVGVTFGFQARTTSPAGPVAAAFTNAVAFVVESP